MKQILVNESFVLHMGIQFNAEDFLIFIHKNWGFLIVFFLFCFLFFVFKKKSNILIRPQLTAKLRVRFQQIFMASSENLIFKQLQEEC